MPYKDKEKKKEYDRKYQKDHKEEIREKRKGYFMKYCQSKSGRFLREQWYQEHKGEIKKNNQTPEAKARKSINDKKHAKKYPEKIRAVGMANHHLKHLKKPGYEFHHPDYSQPLLVEILPIKEHVALHVQLNSQKLK